MDRYLSAHIQTRIRMMLKILKARLLNGKKLNRSYDVNRPADIRIYFSEEILFLSSRLVPFVLSTKGCKPKRKS